MKRKELLSLAARVEALAGPDRMVMGDLLGATGWQVRQRCVYNPSGEKHLGEIPDPTGCLNAARSLVPEGSFWRVGHDGAGPDPSLFRAEVLSVPAAPCEAIAATPELALTAAALRALATGAEA